MKLFVYGTLLTGEPRARLLAGARTPARVRGTLWRLPQGYPALRVGNEGDVWGELVDVDDAMLGMLDTYEGVGEGWFQRVSIPAYVALRPVGAVTYAMADPEAQGAAPVKGGRWRPYARR